MTAHAVKRAATTTGGRFYGVTHCTAVVPITDCTRWWPHVTCGNCLRTVAAREATDTSTTYVATANNGS